jgi:hypothetical protein
VGTRPERTGGLARWWWGFALVPLLSLLFLFEPHSTYRCGICGSTKKESQMRIGPDRKVSIPLGPHMVSTETTDAATGLLGPGHLHRWTFSQGSDGYMVMRWGLI